MRSRASIRGLLCTCQCPSTSARPFRPVRYSSTETSIEQSSSDDAMLQSHNDGYEEDFHSKRTTAQLTARLKKTKERRVKRVGPASSRRTCSDERSRRAKTLSIRSLSKSPLVSGPQRLTKSRWADRIVHREGRYADLVESGRRHAHAKIVGDGGVAFHTEKFVPKGPREC